MVYVNGHLVISDTAQVVSAEYLQVARSGLVTSGVKQIKILCIIHIQRKEHSFSH